MKLELISFKLCPFVQRSVITLKHKKLDFAIEYIDLANKPDWFLKISPLGKVPVLKVDGKVLFESAVINEYLDETTEPHLSHSDPLEKAFERAWIEFGSSMIMTQHKLFTVTTKEEFESSHQFLMERLKHLEGATAAEPYFRADGTFSLVDTAFAPLFTRLFLAPFYQDAQIWTEFPKIKKWADTLVELPAVKDSVVDDFDQMFIDYCKDKNSYAFKDA